MFKRHFEKTDGLNSRKFSIALYLLDIVIAVALLETLLFLFTDKPELLQFMTQLNEFLIFGIVGVQGVYTTGNIVGKKFGNNQTNKQE